MTYQEAFQAACKRALEMGTDQGIEKGPFGFSTFGLPLPQNRTGHELRCEVVSPALAKALQRSDGSFSGGGR